MVDDVNKNIIGCDVLNSLGLAVVQQKSKKGKGVNNVDIFKCKIKLAIASQFLGLFSGIGLSETHIVKSKFLQKLTAKHPKGCRVPSNLQPRVTVELDKLPNRPYQKID